MSAGAKVPGKHPSTPPATDHGVGMRFVTGRCVVVTGKKVDGTEFVRTLANVSIVPGKGRAAHTIVGMDTAKGQVRSFRLIGIQTLRLRNGTATVSGADLVETIEFHLEAGQGPITKVDAVDEVA